MQGSSNQFYVLSDAQGKQFVVDDLEKSMYKAYELKETIVADSLNEAYYKVNEPYKTHQSCSDNNKGLIGKTIQSVETFSDGLSILTMTDGSELRCSLNTNNTSN